MTTVRHIEKLWRDKLYAKLLRQMLSGRPEASLRLELELNGPVPAAAMALLRLDELGQPHVPLYDKLLRAVLTAQEPDGGWGDPMTTALCLRGLMAGQGGGAAIERGLTYLAQLQKSEGIWPKVPLRRMPADPFVSAFVLLELGDHERFRQSVRFADALNWFQVHQHALDPETRRLWDHASIRCRIHRTCDVQSMLSWS
ncbi:hypothetical protein [Fontivita pretiosa]|uniref:hypothetical protein n=1 Tax=Fontivita pretiosa TaxID=2989684 RepID=UPI003D168A48